MRGFDARLILDSEPFQELALPTDVGGLCCVGVLKLRSLYCLRVHPLGRRSSIPGSEKLK